MVNVCQVASDAIEQPTVWIGDRPVGEGHPCFVIAEAGVNHNGSVEMALDLVDVAAEAGADAVKFQKRELGDLYPRRLLDDHNSEEWAFHYLLPVLKQAELNEDEFRRIKDHCLEKGIRFMCTPWDTSSLAFLEELGVDGYKISSADLVNLPLLDQIARTAKPMILSSGMSTFHEIERTVQHLRGLGASFALLHCVSAYPAPFESLNLRFLETLKQFGVPVGYSGHERGIAMPLVALALGASIVEKHITLDRTLPGPDHPASLEPQGIQRLVRDIRHAELALGRNEKRLTTMEQLNRQVLRKSLVAARDLPRGTVVDEKMVTSIGPGKGLSPQRLEELVGVRLDRDVLAGEYFTEGDLKPRPRLQLETNGLRRSWGLKSRFHDLQEILAHKPNLVELHFSEGDLEYEFIPPSEPYAQQLVVHAPELVGRRLVDLCSADDDLRELSFDLIQRTIDRAAELGPHFTGPVAVVIHGGGMTMDDPVDDTTPLLDRAVELFRRFRTDGVQLLPENLPPRPWLLGGQWVQNTFMRPEEMVEFCQELDLAMALDVSHAQLYCTMFGTDLADYVRICLPHAKHLHLADASGIDGEGLQIEEGVVRWDEILELLAGADFTWVPEIWSGHLHHGAGFIEAINRLAVYDKL
jgi:sialic acid synthase SpsE/sugar phosphate isomerase/epimerase